MLHKFACYEFPSFVGLQQICDPHSARSGTECDPDNLSFPCCIFSKIAGHELVMQSLVSSLYNQSNEWEGVLSLQSSVSLVSVARIERCVVLLDPWFPSS